MCSFLIVTFFPGSGEAEIDFSGREGKNVDPSDRGRFVSAFSIWLFVMNLVFSFSFPFSLSSSLFLFVSARFGNFHSVLPRWPIPLFNPKSSVPIDHRCGSHFISFRPVSQVPAACHSGHSFPFRVFAVHRAFSPRSRPFALSMAIGDIN